MERILRMFINQFVAPYIENMEQHNLGVGLWQGSVEFNNLVFKRTVLEDLGVPMQIVCSRVGKLSMKVPWKERLTRFGTSKIEVVLEDVYILIQPNQQVRYDPEAEVKDQLTAKKKAIQRVEEAQKMAENKQEKQSFSASMAESIIAWFLRNLHVVIKNIHIRYEDKVTNPKIPFAFGLTLKELLIQSADEQWNLTDKPPEVKMFYKILSLDSLAIYWNSNCHLLCADGSEAILAALQNEIVSKTARPKDYHYILGPINASARLRLNQKPETDEKPYSLPEYQLSFHMESLFIGISKAQYRDLIALADSMDRMSKGIPFRKYRPNVEGYRGHYKEWWKFAYKCILESEVRRKRNNWDWQHIFGHREMCREYGELYKRKLMNTATKEDNEKLEECEKQLDLHSIVIMRQRIGIEAEKAAKKASQSGGWLSWVWRGGKGPSEEETDEIRSTTDVLRKFENEMTPEEKERLYQAIGYQENVIPHQYPEEYVDKSFTFVLKRLEIEMRDDDEQVKRIVYTELQKVAASIHQRSGGNGLKVDVAVDSLQTFGMQQGDFIPKLIKSNIGDADKLLEFGFQLAPLDKKCDQRVILKALPISVIYDAVTINKAIEIFKIPPDTSLDQISAAADSGFSNIREMTATGLQYTIEQHTRLDLNVEVHAPFIIIPENGKYTGSENVLVANLGVLKMYSKARQSDFNIRKLHSEGLGQEEILRQMIERSYDEFQLELNDVQILMAQKDENWREVVEKKQPNDMHILQPVSMSILYSKCLVTDDPRLPLSKVSGELPSIYINLTDTRLFMLVELGVSIPLPNDTAADEQEIALQTLQKSKSSSSLMLNKYLEMQDKARLKSIDPEVEHIQFTNMEFHFVMQEFYILLTHQKELNAPKTELASFKLSQLTCDLMQQTYSTTVVLSLASIYLDQERLGKKIQIISTPMAATEALFKVTFKQADPRGPNFRTEYHSCETALMLDFGKLGVILHQEGLLALIAFAQQIQDRVNEIMKVKNPVEQSSLEKPKRRLSVISEVSAHVGSKIQKNRRKAVIKIENIKFKLIAKIEEITVAFACDRVNIANMAVRGLNSQITMREPYMQIDAKLKEIAIIDLNPQTHHPLIISSESSDETLIAQIVIYNNPDESQNQPDMSVNVRIGGMKIIFLNWFINNLLQFLNQFQTAQQKVIEASQAAAQQAKDNMKDAYEKATKIALDIKLKAPTILVPVNSSSYDALFVDLGVIYLKNKFTTTTFGQKQAVVDSLNMQLTQMKLARVRLNKKSEVEVECPLLEPVNFQLDIARNLSASWYKEIAEIDIFGKIANISMALSQADYQMAMKVVSENLTEGSEKEVPQPKVQSELQVGQTAAPRVSRLDAIQENEKPKEKPSTFLKLSFSMEKLNIDLYSGGSTKLSGDSPFREVNQHLGRFALEGLSIKSRILSDQSISASVLLLDVRLDDKRPGREGKLNRLIQRSFEGAFDRSDQDPQSSSYKEVAKSMVDVTYQQSGNDMFADVRIFSFTLILCLDYLMKIADVFKLPEEEPKKVSTTTQSSKFDSKKSIAQVPVVQPVPEVDKQMTINLKIEQPDIILVENMDNIDTSAIVLNNEVMVKIRMYGSHQVINGSIKDIQLYTCCYNPAKRAETRCDILHPLTVSLAGSTPQDKGLHLELLITTVMLSVSPSTIELLNRVLATMSGSAEKSSSELEINDNLGELWNENEFQEQDYWFLKTEMATELTESTQIQLARPDTKPPPLQELCIISVPSIVITIEAGVGTKTVPMILFETSIVGKAKNWSSQLMIEATVSLQMGYYNSSLAMWEPLIEPVTENGNMTPWELRIEIAMNDNDDGSNPQSPNSSQVHDVASDMELIGPEPPQSAMSIDITSENNLELTVTKTCLEVLQNLGNAFANAMNVQDIKKIEPVSPYKVINETGMEIILRLGEVESSFALVGVKEDSINEVVLGSNSEVDLQLKKHLLQQKALVRLGAELISNSVNKEFELPIRIDERKCDINLPVVRADKRFFPLNYRDNNENWGIISDVKVDGGVTTIKLRSILQVVNHFSTPIEVYYMTKRDGEVAFISEIPPNGVLDIPLKAVYTPTNELFFTRDNYSISTLPFVWKDLQTNLTVTRKLQCKPKAKQFGDKDFIIKAVGDMEQVYYETTKRHTMASTCYNIHLRPVIVFKNCLPVKVVVSIEETISEFEVDPGDTLEMPHVDPGSTAVVVRLPEYLEKEWSCREEIPALLEEFAVWTFSSHDSAAKMTLDLGMHTLNKNGSMYMKLYCPFWMLNKTGMMLGYRNSDDNLNILHHPPDFRGPVLFSFNAKNFFGKKKAAVRIDQGDWSDKFSLDVAGSSGFVTCKNEGKKYQVGVHNQLTYNGLTKQVTFTPYYVIINNAPYSIECQENDRPGDPWITVEPKSCSALWPSSDFEDKSLRVRIKGTNEISPPFLYTESHTTLLKLKNQYGGINVDIQLTEGAIYISFAAYEEGMAPALMVNHTEFTINYWEKESVQVRDLKPLHCQLYTWENPAGPRVLVWEKAHKREIENDLRKDGLGEFKVTDDGPSIYWASFLDGMQRILLFTTDNALAEGAEASTLFENIQQEITVSLHGMGLSLVNNVLRQEIMYCGIASSGTIWETCKMTGRRFKPLPPKETVAIERAYQRYLASKENCDESRVDHIAQIGRLEIDFNSMTTTKPTKRKLRRTFETGVWMQMKTSPSQMQLHAKVNRIQIDNQMFDCIFPVVLAPVPPPKSVAADSGIKPFIEVSIVQLLMKNSQVRQYKYFKVLIQEFHIKVDLGFVNAIFGLLEESQSTDEDEKKLFLQDMKLVDEELYSHASLQSMQEQKAFYDLLHFSPLKIHVSFSMAAGSTPGQSASTPNFINVLLQGLGVTLTDLQDVVFKLAFFERDYTFLTRRQLISEATSHYVGQSVKQLYVLVLGLDVLGNPYGLVLGITKGVEDLFYEPFQGAIQGPGEFAEGLALGLRSLFGHTVGGAAGAVSKITGAVGKGLAALTFDDEYQRKRRDQLNKKPSTMQEGIARSGKGLVMGVVDGVTGVFTKPVSGAKEQGAKGFFKGLGKGAVGLVARPIAGVTDFASGSLDVVKRATETSEEANRLRAPRFLPADGLVRPYNAREAEGNKLLMDINKGKYASTDVYVAHYTVTQKKEILLLTDKRIAFVSHNDIFGGWQVDWSYTWSELPHPAKVVTKGVSISTSAEKKKMFSSNGTSRVILIADPEIREEICEKIEALRGTI